MFWNKIPMSSSMMFWECKRYQWCPGRIQSCRMLSILWSHGCINRLYGFCDSVLLQRFWAEQYCCTALSCWRLLSRAEKICKAFKFENLFSDFPNEKPMQFYRPNTSPDVDTLFVELYDYANVQITISILLYVICNICKKQQMAFKTGHFLQWRR